MKIISLKSNMDRFIVAHTVGAGKTFESLKSNMDRFIASCAYKFFNPDVV